jgi:flagellar biosynthesis regulator FlaF
MTQNSRHAAQAYKAASKYRSTREQEADVFRYANAMLKNAKNAEPIQQVRAVADNRRLWMMVSDLLRDPANDLPGPLKASILSVGKAVQREMENEKPDFEFLISINEDIAAGMAGKP